MKETTKPKTASLNVRTFKSQENIIEFENVLKDRNLDILGLSKVRSNLKEIMNIRQINLFCYMGNNIGLRGIGFWIDKKHKNNIKEFKRIFDRIATLKLNVTKKEELVTHFELLL